MIFPDLGEIGINFEKGAALRLRPSFYAMSKLGSPTEIVEIFADVMSEYTSDNLLAYQHRAAISVLCACAPDNYKRTAALFGKYADDGTHHGKFIPGLVSPGHALALARSLLHHGIIGKVPPLPKAHDDADETGYMAEFHAREYAAVAMAHLGMSERDAWGCTMTSMTLALRQKFPPPPAKDKAVTNAPNAEEYDAAMAWADKIDALRDMQNQEAQK